MDINMERPNLCSIAAESTAKNSKSDIYGFVGFLIHHFDLRAEQVDLGLYKEPYKFVAFLSFLKQRKVLSSLMRRHTSTASKVIAYLKSAGYGRRTAAYWDRLEDYYKTLGTQISRASHTFGGKRRRDQEKDPLPSGESLLRMADVIACHADQLKAKDKSDNGGIWSNATVKCMRDWAMMSALFGHIPTMRLSTLLTLAHPDFCEDGACTHADCKDELCVGNRMSWVLR